MRTSDSSRTVIPFERWPDVDRFAWQAAVRPGDPFEDVGPAASWRPATQALVRRAYGRWLGYLLWQRRLDPKIAPADRINADLLRGYIGCLQSQCLDTTVTMHVSGLAQALAVMAPEHGWSWLRRTTAQLRGSIRRRKRKDLKVRSSRELFHLGLSLMQGADGASRLAWKQAVQFRDGLLIALLAARPLRLKNLAALEFDRSLVRTGDGFRLLLSPDETKTHVFVDLPLDGALADRLEGYLDHYRPVLLGAKECPLLWITQDGRAMTPGAIYGSITRRTRKIFGVAINPHLFRDCAATSLAIDDPAHVRVATTLLGHGSPTSTTRYYNQATTVTAAGKYAQTVLALRRGRINSRDRNWRLRWLVP